MLLGLTALSEEINVKLLTLKKSLDIFKLYVPKIFVLIAASMLFSIKSTCLYAAACITISILKSEKHYLKNLYHL